MVRTTTADFRFWSECSVSSAASFLSPASSVFCDSQRNILKENDIVRFPKLADTYQRIAEEGPDVFYRGSMAQSMVEDIQAAGLRHGSQ